jgi:hypothetical protein
MNRVNPLTQSNERYNLFVFSILNYELECYVLEDSSSKPILYLRDTTTNEYHLTTDFFSVNWGIEDIKEDLIPTIDEILEQGWGDEILSGQVVSVIIEPEKSFFTKNRDGNKHLGEKKEEAAKNSNAHLSTKVFRAISVKWLEFLEAHKKAK